jgi:hypothetical protein
VRADDATFSRLLSSEHSVFFSSQKQQDGKKYNEIAPEKQSKSYLFYLSNKREGNKPSLQKISKLVE